MDDPREDDHGPKHLLREAPGRETRLCTVDGTRVIEKRYAAASVRGWRAWLAGGGPSPARVEYEALHALAAEGVPVPRPLGLGEDAAGSCVRMEFVPHARTLRERLAEASAAERRALGARLSTLVLRLHRSGWYHRDLYLEHVLVRAGDGALVLIDLGRARSERAPRERWFEKDLAALQHSAPPAVEARERLRFLAGYLDGRGVHGRRERRRFARAVLRRADRMARHRPRHGRSHSLPPEAAS